MDKSKTPLSYATLVAELQKICAEQRTGALLILSPANHPVRIFVKNGEIVALAMQEKKGWEVLALLPQLQASRMQFVSGLRSSQEITLPATSVLLAELAAQTLPPPAPRPVSPSSEIMLDLSALAVVGATLAPYIGPMATIVSKRVLATPQNVKGAIQALAKSIPAPEDARRFAVEMRAKLVV